jgi:para-nitrobenzyl esterase
MNPAWSRGLSSLLVVVACCLGACGEDGEADSGELALGPTESSLQVRTQAGIVHGKRSGTARAFLGIPYAKPPVDGLRWRSPEPAEAWDGQLDAREFGPPCLQLGLGSEDCLSLNVWAPEVSPEQGSQALKPTMVWLHGGAFVGGSNALYDGVNLVERGDVVLVAVNYRLGALGFLAHPVLTQEPGGRGSSGNYGIEDQILALQWVHDNIRAFGGDPERVTLFGESAGSACTCVLLGTGKVEGLVHRAIMESGACLGFETLLPAAEELGKETVSAIGCEGADALACLRDKDAAEISLASTDLLGSLLQQRWRPIVDGVVVPDLAKIQPVKVPIILGTNRNEGGAFGALAGNERDYVERVKGYYPNPEHAAKLLAAYSETTYGSWGNAFSALVTDSLFVCPTRRLARAAAAEVDTYLYSFSHGQAFHADEVPYVFGLSSLSAEARVVSDDMLAAWTSFAHSGNPNVEGGQAWPKYEPGADQHRVFDTAPGVASGLKREACDLLDTLPALNF